VLSVILSAALLVGAVPTYAFASDISSSTLELIEYDADTSTDPADGDNSSPDESAPEPEEAEEVEEVEDAEKNIPVTITGEESIPKETEEEDSDAEKNTEADPDSNEVVDPFADDGSGEGGESEDVAEIPSENITTSSSGNNDSVPTTEVDSMEGGVTITYSADATTSFKVSSLEAGQVWVDKSVSKTSDTETSFSETLSVYANDFTSTSEYSTGNYVLVVDTTRSLYNADHSGALVQAVTAATNSLVYEICKNPLSNVAVIGFSADNRERTKNKNADATTVLLGMGNWSSAGKSLLTCDTSSSNECAWYITATNAAKNAKIATTGKRYISYGTFTQAGVAHAASILKAQSDKADTAGYMILLTDGVPTYGTTKWAAAYSTSNEAWQSKTDYAIGNGGASSPKAAAYTLMTMQYWNNYLSNQYKTFGMYAAHFSNDDYNSDDEAMAKWDCGTINSVTYSAGTSSSANSAGYVGSVISSGWPKNRLSSTYTDSSKSNLKKAAGYLKDLMTSSNLTKLGLSSASTFNAPCTSQFANLSNYSSASNKTTALNHVFDNLQNMIHKDVTTQGGLKSGTNVVFTTKTSAYMTVSGAPVLYYNNKAYSGTKSGSTYTYSINGYTAKVVVSTSDNQSTVTVTIPGDLVNKNGLDNGTYPIQCKFNVDLFSSDYKTVYNAAGGSFTTYTNEYSTSKTTVTYTTASDNPYYASTGTVTSNKSKNTTGTLAYVSSLTKAKAGKQSTVYLGNNGKLGVTFNWGNIEILVWEQNQADETKVLPNVTYHLADTEGNKIILDGQELTFTSNAEVQTVEALPAGTYWIVADSVPDGYVVPENTVITVKNQTGTQHYDVYVPTIFIDVWAIDSATEEVVDGVKVTVYDAEGKAVYQDVSLEFVQEYVPAGDYTIQVTAVPNRYRMPDDTDITVEQIRDKQDFIIPLEHLGSITIKKYDADGDPLSGVSYDLSDADGNIIMTKTTDKNGEAVFMDKDKLVPGDYVVTETKTGKGLSLLSDSIKVTIPVTMTDEEATAQNADTSKGWHNKNTGTWYFYDVSYEITNHSNFAVPMTGGSGLYLTGVFAFAMLTASAAFLLFRKKVK
jgi:hypothetical protein